MSRCKHCSTAAKGPRSQPISELAKEKLYQYLKRLIESEIVLFQEKSRIGRGLSCVRTDEIPYLADDGRGGVKRELRLWWLRVCRGVLRPPSVNPASC